MQSKHLIFSILILLVIIFSSCSGSNCDCSYEAFNKIRRGMTVNNVSKLLKTKPFKVIKDGDWTFFGFKCNENTITISTYRRDYSSDSYYDIANGVYDIAFNAPIYRGNRKIDFK